MYFSFVVIEKVYEGYYFKNTVFEMINLRLQLNSIRSSNDKNPF